MRRGLCPLCLTAETPIEETILAETVPRPGVFVDCVTCGRFAAVRAPGMRNWLGEVDAANRGALAGVLRRAVDRGEPSAAVLTPQLVAELVRLCVSN